MDIIKKIDRFLVNEESYEEFFKKKLKEWNISSPTELSDEDKKKFFEQIKNEWK